MTAEFFQLNDRKLAALIEATVHDMQEAEKAILRKAEDDYRKAIFNAQVYANTGAGTYEKAVDMATRDMLSAALAVWNMQTDPSYSCGLRQHGNSYRQQASVFVRRG